MGKRIIRALDGLLNGIILMICALLLFVSVYSLLDNYLIYKNANDASLEAYRPQPTPAAEATAEPEPQATVEPEPQATAEPEMQFISGKQAGWLQVYDTTIDYPLMRGDDNFEFLNLDPYGEYRVSGSIYMDFRNTMDCTDPYIVVYGHHMGMGGMFGALDAFMEQDYFDAHRTGRIVTRNGSLALELFAVASADANDPILFNPEGRTTEEVDAILRQNAMIYMEHPEDRNIVALTTCWGETELSRLLVFGTLTPDGV